MGSGRKSICKNATTVFALFISFSISAADRSAGKIFEDLEGRIFIVKTALSADSPRTSYGSGFAFAKNGLIVTNFHVVADAFMNEKEYSVFTQIGGAWMKSEIVDANPVRDLALLKVDKVFSSVIPIRTERIRKGEKLFSLGLPEDLNMSIVEGNYNGELLSGPFVGIQMTTPLNPGMSGGPTVDANEHLVAVNAAYLSDAQNISFGVPAHYVLQLNGNRTKSKDAKERRAELLDNMTGILKNVASEMKTDVLAAAKKTLHLPGWKVATVPDYLQCSSESESPPEKKFQLIKHYCYMSSGSYIGHEMVSSTFEVHYQTLSRKKINPWRLFQSALAYFNNFRFWNERIEFEEDGPAITESICRDFVLKNKSNIPFKIRYCMNGLVQYKDLYDMDFKAITLDMDRPILTFHGRFVGFEQNQLTDILDTFVNSVSPEGSWPKN